MGKGTDTKTKDSCDKSPPHQKRKKTPDEGFGIPPCRSCQLEKEMERALAHNPANLEKTITLQHVTA